jgi:hypothetical protein
MVIELQHYARQIPYHRINAAWLFVYGNDNDLTVGYSMTRQMAFVWLVGNRRTMGRSYFSRLVHDWTVGKIVGNRKRLTTMKSGFGKPPFRSKRFITKKEFKMGIKFPVALISVSLKNLPGHQWSSISFHFTCLRRKPIWDEAPQNQNLIFQ